MQRCTVHKERNLLAHAPKHVHDQIKADNNDMMYAKDAGQAGRKRKAFLPMDASAPSASQLARNMST